jgi:hypothetical protein
MEKTKEWIQHFGGETCCKKSTWKTEEDERGDIIVRMEDG